MKELVISNTEAKGQLGTGVFGALYKGIETVGQTTGFINVPALLAAKRGEKGVLEGTQKELEGPTEVPTGIGVREGMSPTEVLAYLASPAGRAAEEQIFLYGNEAEKKALSTWVTNISNNSEAILQNTQEIAKLNGALNQPQTWSTAAQQLFRNSIFTGMGQLLPEYQNVLPPGARPEGLPKYGVATPGAAVGGPNIGAIHLTHPVEKIDPQLFGEELSFHIATTPSMG